MYSELNGIGFKWLINGLSRWPLLEIPILYYFLFFLIKRNKNQSKIKALHRAAPTSFAVARPPMCVKKNAFLRNNLF